MGIPTLNFAVSPSLNIPYGVYAGRLFIGNNSYPAAVHFGPRPVFGERGISLEAYILDPFSEQITEGELEFIQFIREIRNFPDPKNMVVQIKNDVQKISEILEQYKPETTR